MFSQMSNEEILIELGDRIRQKRLNKNKTHIELVDQTGLSRATISKIEKGQNSTILNIILVLRALDAIDQLDLFLPPTLVDPATLAKLDSRKRKRASKTKSDQGTDWAWGE